VVVICFSQLIFNYDFVVLFSGHLGENVRTEWADGRFPLD
jgi:hypothetical protein